MTIYVGIFHNNPNIINYSDNPKLKEVTECYKESNAKFFICFSNSGEIDIPYTGDTLKDLIEDVNICRRDYKELNDFTEGTLKECIENTICDEESSYFGTLFENGEPKWFPKEVNLIHLTFTNEE